MSKKAALTDTKPVNMESLEAVPRLRDTIIDNFNQMGRCLSEVKEQKSFRLKGFTSFKDYVKQVARVPYSLACHLIRVHEVFVLQGQYDEAELQMVGFDKLDILAPVCKDNDPEEVEKWVEKAKETGVDDLRDDVAQARKAANPKEKTLKQLVVEQFIDEMTAVIGCTGKDLSFFLALYFRQLAEDSGTDTRNTEIKRQVKRAAQQFYDHPEEFTPQKPAGE